MRALALLIALLCSAVHAQGEYSAVAADAATTAAGLSTATLVESNPLSWATVPIRFALIEYAKVQPIAEGTPTLHAVSAVSWGAAASNLCLLTGPGMPVCYAIGLSVGAYNWQSGSDERLYWQNCETHRRIEPEHILACSWPNITKGKS